MVYLSNSIVPVHKYDKVGINLNINIHVVDLTKDTLAEPSYWLVLTETAKPITGLKLYIRDHGTVKILRISVLHL